MISALPTLGSHPAARRHRRADQGRWKIANSISSYLYPTLESIRHGGEEDAAPIRFEHLSDFQLEALIKRLERG